MGTVSTTGCTILVCVVGGLISVAGAVSCTTTDSPLCSGVVVNGTDVTELEIVRCRCTGDAFTGAMGTTGTFA